MNTNDVTANLWVARYLQDRELELALEGENNTIDIEEIQLEECVFGNDPYNSIGKNVRR